MATLETQHNVAANCQDKGLNQMSVITRASKEWATRPADQRFVGLPDLCTYLDGQRQLSRATCVSSRGIEARPMESDELGGIEIHGPNGHGYQPTHWAFGQLAGLAGAPAGYLRDLPAPIACDALNYGLKFNRDIEDVGVLLRKADNVEDSRLAAATGPRYGRIWNNEIAHSLQQRFGDGLTGQWKVPGEFGKHVDVDKRNTTIYASDRDMFVFLCDEENRVTIPNRRHGQSGSLARGFFVWNSEVGSQSIGAAFFLFDYVCQNRMIWGAAEFTEIRLRHTVSAPDRWLSQITPVLNEYAESATRPIVDTIKAAQSHKLDDAKAWLAKRYSVKLAAQINASHEREEGRPVETLWDAVTGLTALAKGCEYQDKRVAMERDAGKLLTLSK